MRRIKKIASVFFLLLCIVGIGYWWRYNKAYTYGQGISKEANLLIDIDLRGVENTLLWDFLANPLNGLSLDWPSFEKKDEEDKKTPSQGWSLPRHLIFFSNSGHGDVFFSAPIRVNGSKFSEYADTMLARKDFLLIDSAFVYDTQKKLFYHWSDKLLSVAFAKMEQAKYTKSQLQNLIDNKNTQPLPERFIQENKNKIHHINIWRKPSSITNNQPVFLYADFLKGHFNIEGNVPFKYVFAQANQKPVFTKDAAMDFYANFQWDKNELKELIQQEVSAQDFSKWTSMSLDSVLNYWTGEVSIQIPSIESAIDSIVTYEYDDDFNKTEIVTTKQVLKPKAQFLFSTKDHLFFRYAQSVGVIKPIDKAERYVGFPLLKLFAQANGQQLSLSTELKPQKVATTDTKSFLSLEVKAYPEILDLLPFNLTEDQKAKLKGLSIQCQSDANGFHLKGEIQSKDSKRFFLGS